MDSKPVNSTQRGTGEMASQKLFHRWVKKYGGDLYRLAVWLSRDRALAEDLVQETWLRAWRHVDKLRDEKVVKSWLISILRRENARRFERPEPLSTSNQAQETENFTIDSVDPDVYTLHNALSELPECYRKALTFQLSGYRAVEVAKMLNIEPSTVAVRVHRARNMLRKILSGEGGESKLEYMKTAF